MSRSDKSVEIEEIQGNDPYKPKKKILWVARDQDKTIALFHSKPKITKEFQDLYWRDRNEKHLLIPKSWFPEVKFENSPRKLKLDWRTLPG